MLWAPFGPAVGANAGMLFAVPKLLQLGDNTDCWVSRPPKSYPFGHLLRAGNEVTDDHLAKAFSKYASFAKAKVSGRFRRSLNMPAILKLLMKLMAPFVAA